MHCTVSVHSVCMSKSKGEKFQKANMQGKVINVTYSPSSFDIQSSEAA